MLWADLLRLALEALGRQKLRTTLTTLGIVAGTIALCSSLSLGRGVQEAIVREYSRYHELRHVEVYGGWDRSQDKGTVPPDVLATPGAMTDARRARLADMKELRWRTKQPFQRARPLDSSVLRALAQIPHVVAVNPDIDMRGGRGYLGERFQELMNVASVSSERELLSKVIVAGRTFDNGDEPGVLISEYALYQFGVTDEADVAAALGRMLRVEITRGGNNSSRTLLALLSASAPNLTSKQEETLETVVKALPSAIDKIDLPPEEKRFVEEIIDGSVSIASQESRIVEEYPIRGVFRALTEDESRSRGRAFSMVDVILANGSAERLYFRFPDNVAMGLNRLTLEVDDTTNVREVTKAVKAKGLNYHSLIEQIEIEQFTYLLIFAGMTMVAVLAFIVAALGITNTMLMSVLERTREIGIMKAVGASNWHVALLFLVEGLLLGLVGGLVGLAITRLAAIPGDAWVRSMLAQRTQIKLSASLFVFPWWLTVGAPLFACLVTTLAAWPPSRRAARVPPVEALREPG